MKTISISSCIATSSSCAVLNRGGLNDFFSCLALWHPATSRESSLWLFAPVGIGADVSLIDLMIKTAGTLPAIMARSWHRGERFGIGISSIRNEQLHSRTTQEGAI